VNNPLDVKKIMSMLLTLFITCLAFSDSVNLDFPCMAHGFSPERLSNNCKGLRRTFSLICTKFDAVPLSNPCEIASVLIHNSKLKDVKNQHAHSAA
jgi:hypothetical protein